MHKLFEQTRLVRQVSAYFVLVATMTCIDIAVANDVVSADLPIKDADNGYIFVFHDHVQNNKAADIATEMVTRHAGSKRHVFKNVLKGFSAKVSAQAAASMGRHPDIKYYEKNGIVKAIAMPSAPQGRPARTKANLQPQIIPWGITRVGGPLAGNGKHAWVLDTGIDLDHPDLNVGIGANFAKGKNANDKNGHGTHVAGTIAAIDNAIDVVGVAAGAMVHPVRVLNNRGSGTIDGVIAGIDFVVATAQAGDVANMSLGAPGHYRSLHDAVEYAAKGGILFAIAAGNERTNASNSEPAHIEHPNVFTVSAIDSRDVFAGFSNYGNPPVDFAAPGVGVLSSRIGGGVVSYSGTSMAAPHVAGLLLLLGNPHLDGFALSDPDGSADPIAHY